MKSGLASRAAIAALCMCLVATTATAQSAPVADETRASELEAQRRAKAAAAEPNTQSRAETGFLYVEEHRLVGRVFDPPMGVFAQVGGLSEGAGFAFGGGYRFVAGAGGAIDVRGVASVGLAWLADVTWRSDLRNRRRISFAANVASERHGNQRFYGLGPDTTTTYDSDFDLDERRVAGGMNVRLMPWLLASVGGGFARMRLSDVQFDFDDDDDVIDPLNLGRDVQVQQFLDDDIPGLRDTAHLAHVDARVFMDTRGLQRAAGTRIEVRQAWYQDTQGAPLDFAVTHIDLQQFIPIWNDTRVFALRAAADRLVAGDGNNVPFYLQPTIGGSRTLRAFDRQRFRDTSTLLLQAEYRYAVNPFLSGALFAETGQVASDWRHFSSRQFRGDYGIGLRVGYGRSVVLRTDVAFGGEGPRLIIALNGMFN